MSANQAKKKMAMKAPVPETGWNFGLNDWGYDGICHVEFSPFCHRITSIIL